VRLRRKFNIVVYSELKVKLVVWPEAKVIIVVWPGAKFLSRGGIGSFACPLILSY
jgi:hypothetical protein